MSGSAGAASGSIARFRGRARRAAARHPRVYRSLRRVKVIGRYLLRRPHEADFGAIPDLGLNGRLFLDVGANCGQSALSFRIFDRRSPILSVEANPALEADLRLVGRIIPRFSYLMYAAGAADGPITLSIPMYRGVQITGEASTLPDDGEPGWWERQHLDTMSAERMSSRTVSVPCIRLDALGLAPGFVKIDVEGATEQVIDGLWQTLTRWRPPILIESDTDHESVASRLARIGYAPYSWDTSTRRFTAPRAGEQNLFFLAEPAAADR